MDDDTDRLLSEKKLKELIGERCGLEASKFYEILRDCPTAHALPLHSGEMRNGGTHNTGIENKAGTTP